jgi:hypothetical protein
MLSCTACSSFVPATRSVCPACGTAVTHSTAAKVVGGVLTLAGGSLFAMTLTACYGSVAEPYYPDASTGDAPGCTDMDDDGFCGELDCDETDAAIYVGAPETAGDGIDSDCGGTDANDE